MRNPLCILGFHRRWPCVCPALVGDPHQGACYAKYCDRCGDSAEPKNSHSIETLQELIDTAVDLLADAERAKFLPEAEYVIDGKSLIDMWEETAFLCMNEWIWRVMWKKPSAGWKPYPWD